MASLSERLRADETIFTAWSGVPDPLTVELMAAQAFDAVTLDMQHGGHGEDSVLRALPAVLHAKRHAGVRIPVGRWDMASRALDFGAEAVIAPMINSVADAYAFAQAAKYPPLGQRSWGPTFALPRSGRTMPEFLAGSNTGTVSFAMIETREALGILDDILAVPGIDAVFLGPSDFSIAWTDGAQVDPSLEDMMEAVGDVARRARAAGKFAGIYLMDVGLAGRFAKMGYRFFALASELAMFRTGSDVLLRTAKASL
ncbi:MAG: 2,4-dihydroxyhept-2-ene-1,7-dioic acid aldolase [Mesorhizobium amorphae]|nr:MAG: 2,4-dihydroxyhept-2-ene-1,7-dioic acid aldolase [Mesorhizobium amorphae]